MPSHYAHYLFGKQLLPCLPDELQQVIAAAPQLYQIGQHSPDIMFYYRTFLPRSASRIGFRMHRECARPFFEQARRTIQHTQDKRLIAYTLGFVCHYMLDSTCHAYIYDALKNNAVSHTEMETEFDRMLMLQQHKNPMTTDATAYIHATKENARLIAKIFTPLKPEQIYESMRSMKFVHRLLICPNTSKRCTMYRILNMLHHKQYLTGLIMTPTPNPLYEESNQHLYQLYQQALDASVPVLTQYYQSIFTNEPLSNRFDYNFRGERLR